MTTVPVRNISCATETLEERFRRLEKTLLDDVKDVRSQTAIVNHAAFREIINLGEAVVPLMLEDLDKGPRFWIWVLPEITRADPVKPSDAGNIAKMSLAWLSWARENGYKTKGIDDHFPSLKGLAYEVTGPRDPDYNCVAWAIGVTDKWWSPAEKAQWPDGVPREQTLAAYQAVFESLGYAVCDQSDVEPAFEKVALFHNPAKDRVHAARQLKNGRWTSKLGKLERIEHALRDLEGVEYGLVVVVMKRPVE